MTQKLKCEGFKDFQALFDKLKDFQRLEFLFSNLRISTTFKFSTNTGTNFEARIFIIREDLKPINYKLFRYGIVIGV